MDSAILGQKPAFAVLLLHGLCGPADELKPIAVRIQKQFGKAALIMQPPCRARLKSAIRPIDQQAFDVYKHIERESMNYGKALSSLPLIIIGYSQGGLLACILGKSYKDRLNIVGIVTLNAPLVGTPLLERRRKDLQTFISHAEKGLRFIAYPLYRVKWSMALQGWIWMLTRLRWMPLDGLKDMLPSSACIENVYNFLQDNADIPCLLIATHQNDFAELFHINIQTSQHYREIEALNDAYALLITGKKDGRHDTLIPLSSQLGKKDYLNNQIPIDTKYTIHRSPCIEGAKKLQIKQRIYKGILHASNLVAIDPRLFVDRGEKVLCADAVLTDVMQFIDVTIAPFCFFRH